MNPIQRSTSNSEIAQAKSFIASGAVPTGNTGGTNISMFKRMPIETKLQHIIDGRAPSEQARRPNP